MLTSVLSVKLDLDRLFAVEFNVQAVCCFGKARISAVPTCYCLDRDERGLLMSRLPRGGFWHVTRRLSLGHLAENSPNCSESFA